MITKTQAAAIQTAAVASMVATLPDKLSDALRTAASNGLTGITFGYFPASSAAVDAFITSVMAPAGWTVVNNNIATPGNFTITVS